jgi:hypothetical protein
MKMITEANEPHHYDQKTQLIKAKVSSVIKKWGLLPRFKRWRLTKDPGTGMVVLFGILNNKYIAANTSIPFSNYFDPRLLHDLANELQVQVVSCNSDGLRYAFILDRGSLGKLPTHIDYPFIDNDKLVVRVVYSDVLQTAPDQPVTVGSVDDHTLVHQGVGAFLKVFDDIKLRDDIALQVSSQALPEIVLIDEDAFKRRVEEREADRQRSKRLQKLFDETGG